MVSISDMVSYASFSSSPFIMHSSRRWSSSFFIMEMLCSLFMSTADILLVFKRLGDMRWFSMRDRALASDMESI